MRALTPIAVLAVVVGTSACVRHGAPEAVQQTHTFPAHAGKLVRLDVRSLDVHVRVAEADAVSVTVELSVQSSSRAWTRRWVERNTPVFEDSDSVLEVRLPETERHGLFIIGFVHTRARLDLVVPSSCRLEVRTSSGDVRIEGSAMLAGPVRVHTSSGDVTVTGGVHELIADTSSGDVRVSGPALAAFEADTSSGDVTLTGGAAKAVVDTSSGDLRMEKLGGDVAAETSSGDVGASWEQLPAGSKVRVRTSSGDVRLRVPDGTRLNGGFSTGSGSLHSEIPGTRDQHGHQLSFEATGPAVAIEVRTSSGDVVLRTRS
jgi:DUF4097 and DUF4098 domain-containing protein YvlB